MENNQLIFEHPRYREIFLQSPLDNAMPTLLPRQGSAAIWSEEWLQKLPPLEQALWWLYVDDLDRSHVLCQDYSSGLGAYIHGVVHRREGDFWNSKYWFRKTSVRIAEIEPSKFVDQVEAVRGMNPPELLALQRKEWLGLLELAREQ